MNTFNYERATTSREAVHAGAARGAKFLAGGTNLVDLMKYRVEAPTVLVDINRLNLKQVTQNPDGGDDRRLCSQRGGMPGSSAQRHIKRKAESGGTSKSIPISSPRVHHRHVPISRNPSRRSCDSSMLP